MEKYRIRRSKNGITGQYTYWVEKRFLFIFWIKIHSTLTYDIKLVKRDYDYLCAGIITTKRTVETILRDYEFKTNIQK